MNPPAKSAARKRPRRASERSTARPVAKRKEESSPSLGEYLRRQRNLANKSLRKVAEQTGIPTSLLGDIERGIRKPSRALLGSLAGALRLSAETLYLQAGVIDPQGADESDVVREIERDPRLSQRQAEILIDLYRTFREVGEERG